MRARAPLSYRCPLTAAAPRRAAARRTRRGAPGGDVLGLSDPPGEPRPTEAPRPGDPRAGGPRPAAAGRDLLWMGLAGALVSLTVVQLVGLVVALLRLEVAPTRGALFLGFLVTVVWLLTIFWLVMGAWRRTVWGCPFEHDEDAPAARRCQRHGAAPPGGRD